MYLHSPGPYDGSHVEVLQSRVALRRVQNQRLLLHNSLQLSLLLLTSPELLLHIFYQVKYVHKTTGSPRAVGGVGTIRPAGGDEWERGEEGGRERGRGEEGGREGGREREGDGGRGGKRMLIQTTLNQIFCVLHFLDESCLRIREGNSIDSTQRTEMEQKPHNCSDHCCRAQRGQCAYLPG